MTKVHSADQAAREALDRAQQAVRSRTFGVGALLVDDRTGEVLDAAPNRVIGELPFGPLTVGEDGRTTFVTHDPTAHGERQLITRFYERARETGGAHAPDELTIISSLEPCAMCSGAILASGFKVGVVALDPVAGLGMAEGSRFRDLPEGLREAAEGAFGYYEIPGLRPFSGSDRIAFAHDESARLITREVHDSCEKTFGDSLDQAMAIVSEGGDSYPREDPFDLSSDDPIRPRLEEGLPHFLSIRLDDPRKPDEELFRLLEAISQRGRGSAAAFVDLFGNLIIASGGGPPEDPIATGFAEMIRTYSRLRFELAGDPSLSDLAGEYLGHPKFGTIYRYPVPNPEAPTTLFELGAYGSTMEGPLPTNSDPNLHVIGEGIDGTHAGNQLRTLVDAMPPFYSQSVGLDIVVSSF